MTVSQVLCWNLTKLVMVNAIIYQKMMQMGMKVGHKSKVNVNIRKVTDIYCNHRPSLRFMPKFTELCLRQRFGEVGASCVSN